ncbi:MAG: hypothetical protein GQ552_07915 [Flavobacteriaceae bacterium]|nr:hypothetical protein [Flavobacteriaceae bacterium]
MKQGKNVDKFIKEGLEVENTSLGFSDSVMQQIYALDIEKEKVLTSLLQKHTLQEPSLNFTANVLSEIHLNSKASLYQPVISKKGWYAILVVLLSLSVYVFTTVDETSIQSNMVNSSLIKLENVFSFNLPTLLTSPLFALSIFALSSLLFLDYFLQKRKLSS